MKKIILPLIFLSISSPLQANDWRALCGDISGLASQVMKSRQSGIPMSAMIQATQGDSMMENMIISAFETPRYSSEKVKKRTIEDFRDKIYLECIKALKEQNKIK